MEISSALEALAALAQETRLEVFRLLVRRGPQEIGAGEIAERLGVVPATLSSHLAQLERAGLATSRRQGRQILYGADVEGMRRLLDYLMADCCQGRPEICAGLMGAIPTSAALRDPVDGKRPEARDAGTASPRRARATAEDRPYNVLFVCTHNSARSVIAECILNRLGQGRFRGFSAGSHPSGRINPYVRELLERFGYPVAGLRSKDWDEFIRPTAPPMDFVITVCDQAAGEVCPVWPGAPVTAHWSFPDPSKATGGEAAKRAFVADIFGRIHNRVAIFASLPVASLDRLALTRHLKQIGGTCGGPADA